MTKQELLDDLAANVVRVVHVLAQQDAAKEAAGINSYAAEVMEPQGGNRATGRTIVFYVLDEGEPTESAWYKDALQMPRKMYQDAVTYLSSQGFIRFERERLHPENGYAVLKVYKDNGDGTATEQRILLFYDADSRPAHRVLS